MNEPDQVRLVVCEIGYTLVQRVNRSEQLYRFIGGHIQENETPEEAIVRTTYELAYLKLDPKMLQLLFTYCNTDAGEKHCNYYFGTSQKNLMAKGLRQIKNANIVWMKIKNVLPLLGSQKHAVALKLIEKFNLT